MSHNVLREFTNLCWGHIRSDLGRRQPVDWTSSIETQSLAPAMSLVYELVIYPKPFIATSHAWNSVT